MKSMIVVLICNGEETGPYKFLIERVRRVEVKGDEKLDSTGVYTLNGSIL